MFQSWLNLIISGYLFSVLETKRTHKKQIKLTLRLKFNYQVNRSGHYLNTLLMYLGRRYNGKVTSLPVTVN